MDHAGRRLGSGLQGAINTVSHIARSQWSTIAKPQTGMKVKCPLESISGYIPGCRKLSLCVEIVVQTDQPGENHIHQVDCLCIVGESRIEYRTICNTDQRTTI